MSSDDGRDRHGCSAYGIGSAPSRSASADPAPTGRPAPRKGVAVLPFRLALHPPQARTGETADAVGLGRLRLGLNVESPSTLARRPPVPSP